MSSRFAAPRRKPKADAPPLAGGSQSAVSREPRSTKLTCTQRICNDAKWADLVPHFDRVCALKNRMSAFVHDNALWVLANAYRLKGEYTRFNLPELNAWEHQALFHDIVGDYQRSLGQRFKAHPFVLQAGFTCERYRKAVVRVLDDGARLVLATKGDPKPGTFQLRHRKTLMTSLATYLLRVHLPSFDPAALEDSHPLKADLCRIQADPEKWAQLRRVVRQRQVRLLSRQAQVHYVTGTYRIHAKESRSGVVIDPSNGQYQAWLKLRTGVGKTAHIAHLPLLYNPARLRNIANGDVATLAKNAEYRLKLSHGKLSVCATFEAKAPTFMDDGESLGIDLNTKRSFATDSHGRTYRLDDLLLQQGLALLDKIDRDGGVAKMGYRRAAQLRQWLRRNEAMVKQKLSSWCKEWKDQGISDIWLEDLAMSHDTTFIRHPALGEKYSRVLRLMRLSGVKDWLLSIAEKQGMRVHTTNPAYTSQECPQCHHIDRANRPTQAEFRCVHCGFEGDADHVAAWNIRARGKAPLRERLHEKDDFERCSPKPLRRSSLKALLSVQKDTAGGVTELPTPALPTKLGAGLPRSSGSSAYIAVRD